MFLAFDIFHPITSLLGDALDALLGFFVGILLTLDAIVYSLINWVYKIILLLCQVDILSNSTEMDALIGRIYTIIGVVVLFLVAYSLLKSMVNPEEALKGKKSPVTIIKDVVISIVLIALVPTIFTYARDFQMALLEQNTVGKIILGTTSSTTGEGSQNTIDSGGMEIATGVLNAFLHENYENCTFVGYSDANPNGYECTDTLEGVAFSGMTFSQFWNEMKTSDSLLSITSLANDIVDSRVTYYFIISTVAGVFVLLVILSYCFDIAIRTVKLAVYELIAPLPILSRIMPTEDGNKVFNNWVKATLSTYVEVFIRLAILFFSVLLIKIVVQTLFSGGIFAPLLESGETGITVALFAQMFIIVGIIMFIRQAPNIIKEVTGLDGGKYNVLGSAMKTAAALGSVGRTAIRNWNTKEDAEGNQKGKWNRFRSALAGGVSAGARSAWNAGNIKDWKSMRENSLNATEAATKKRIERESQKIQRRKDNEALSAEWNAERLQNGKDAIESDSILGAIRYTAHRKKTQIKDWAGANNFNSLAATRIQELASKVDPNYSTIEDTYKKSQAYIDARAAAEKLAGTVNAYNKEYEKDLRGVVANKAVSDKHGHDFSYIEKTYQKEYLKALGKSESAATQAEIIQAQNTAKQILKNKNIDYDAASADYQASFDSDSYRTATQAQITQAETQAKTYVKQNLGQDIDQIRKDYNSALTTQKYRERQELSKKADVAASAARTFFLNLSQYSETKVFERTAKTTAMEQAYAKYGDLSDPAKYEQFVNDLKSSDDATYQMARAYTDLMDAVKTQAKNDASRAAFEEQRRKSSMASSDKGDKK